MDLGLGGLFLVASGSWVTPRDLHLRKTIQGSANETRRGESRVALRCEAACGETTVEHVCDVCQRDSDRKSSFSLWSFSFKIFMQEQIRNACLAYSIRKHKTAARCPHYDVAGQGAKGCGAPLLWCIMQCRIWPSLPPSLCLAAIFVVSWSKPLSFWRETHTHGNFWQQWRRMKGAVEFWS